MNRFFVSVISVILFQFLIFNAAISQGVPDSTFNTLLRMQNGGWVAGDATYSIALPDGRTLWLFGDSFIGTVNTDSSLASGASMIRNCAVVQSGDTMTALYQGTFENPIDFVETTVPDSTWYWPEHGVVEDDTLRIIFSEFGTNGGPSGWNFEYRDAYVVNFSYPDIEFVNQTILPYYEINGVMYGDRIMNYGDYTYIYGRKEENPDNHIPHAHIARCAIGNILSDWEFYDGNYWVSEPEETSKIMSHPVSQQYGVFPHMDKFVLITQEIWLGTKVYSLVANQPEGPFSNLKVLYETPYPFQDMLTYNSYPHPQFNQNNELLVSYNSNGDFWEIFNNVELYRPNFFRVPFTSIHYTFTPTVIDDMANNEYVRCFPNPASDYISFQIGNPNISNAFIEVFNLFGEKVRSISIMGSNNNSNLSRIYIGDIPKGLYLYKVKGVNGKFIHN